MSKKPESAKSAIQGLQVSLPEIPAAQTLERTTQAALESLAGEAVEALEAGALANPRHEKFARLMADHGIGRKAAQEAGWAGDKDTVYYLMHRPDIVARIKQVREIIWKPVIMEQQEILGRLSNICRASVAELFNSDGTLRALDDIPDEILASIESLEHKVVKVPGEDVTESVRKVNMPSKIAAYTLLMKFHKMLGENVLKVEVDMATVMDKARERRRKAAEQRSE